MSTEGEEVMLDLRITAEEFEAYYRGSVSTVQARDSLGRRIRFPARILRPYLRRDGIRGRFVIRFDADRRFESIRQL